MAWHKGSRYDTPNRPPATLDESQVVVDLLDLGALGRSMQLSAWSIEAEIAQLVKIARTDPDAKLQMEAMREIRLRAVQAMRMAGMLTKTTEAITMQRGDLTVGLTRETMRLAEKARSTTEELLRAGLSGSRTLVGLPGRPTLPDPDTIEGEITNVETTAGDTGSAEGHPEEAGR